MAEVEPLVRSELARACLPSPQRAIPRRLAWANSISLMFLLIGIAGAQSHLSPRKSVPPLEQPVPIIAEPLPPPPQQQVEAKPSEAESSDDKPVAPSVVQSVTIETPAINFSVPTQGSLLSAVAVAPEAERAAVVAKQATVSKPQEPQTVSTTGHGGDRPDPPYPREALLLRQEGKVVLELTVDDAGAITKVSVQNSSGSAFLDQATEEWVLHHWKMPVEKSASHIYLQPFNFKIKKKS
jgi:TonB family protein